MAEVNLHSLFSDDQEVVKGEVFRQFIADHYAPHGERHRVTLRSSRELVYSLRNTYPVTEAEVTAYMTEMGYETVNVDGEPLWRLYELHDYEV